MAQPVKEDRGKGAARLRLGELLLQHGVVTPDQVRTALGRQKATGHRLGKNLVQLGFVDENMLVKILASQLSIAGANLNKMEIPPEVQRLVPLEVMLDAGVLPVKLHENTLYLGMTDPTDTTDPAPDPPPGGGEAGPRRAPTVAVGVRDGLLQAERRGQAVHEYGVALCAWDDLPRAGAIVAAVAHDDFRKRPVDDLLGKLLPGGLYVDVKCQADAEALRGKGLTVWRL